MKCPICKGSGHLPEPKSTQQNAAKQKARMAKVLRDNGFSLRQIQSFIGWKSVRSVTEAIEKETS
ncbi:MAG: hypothetical protein E6Q97_04315 [Desulfurellales bacterium]|nr:MAG: hypothetical protein E6Q97_04315 [Desulfurellales bacterium]